MSVVNDVVSVSIFKGFGIFIMILGTVGNISSIIVLASRSALSRLKIRPYLIALAVFDFLCLYLLLLPALVIFSYGSNGKPRTPLQCKLMIYSGFFVIDCSSWVTVAITVERLLYVVHPFMVRPQRGTTIALTLVISLVAVINIPISMGWTTLEGKCHVKEVYYYIIHFMICSYIPAIIMVLSNIIIAFTLCHRPKLVSSATTQRNNSIRIAVAVNIIFLCTTFPVTIVWAVVQKLYLPLYILHYANYAVNFVTYIIAGQLFREEVKAMLFGKFKCCQPSETNPVSSSGTTAETGTSVDAQV